MVIESIQILSKRYRQCGGLYIIQTQAMKAKGWIKVGMSQTNIYRRIDSYINVLPCGFDIHGLLLMANRTKIEKEHIRKCERFVMEKLNPAPIECRVFPTRIEIFTNTLDEILTAVMLAQEKFSTLHHSTNNEPLVFDTKYHEVKEILKHKKDSIGRIQYHTLWSDGSKTWEFEATFVGTDTKGEWIVGAFKKYKAKSKIK